MTPEIPVDIWLLIADFIPEETLKGLYAVNKVFFELAMDLRYSEIEMSPVVLSRQASSCERALGRLLNVQQPLLAPRVRKLKIANVPEHPLLAHMELPDQLTLLTRAACEYIFPRPTTKIFRVIQATLSTLPNVTHLEIELWSKPVLLRVDPLRRSGALDGASDSAMDMEALARSVHEGLASTLQSLTLLGMHTSLADYLLSVMQGGGLGMPCLRHLRIELFPGSESDAARIRNTELLKTVLAPFVNAYSTQLTALEIVLVPPTAASLPEFFDALDEFPALDTFTVHAPFDVAFPGDPLPLSRFIHLHSATLRSLTLRLNPSRSGVNADTEEALAHWLYQQLFTNPVSFPSLQDLTLYPTRTALGFQALLSFLASPHRLSRLAVRDSYLSPDQVDTLVSALPGGGMGMRWLRLNTMVINASLLDLLSSKVPKLTHLTMSSMKYGVEQDADSELFQRELVLRNYSSWPLRELNLRHKGAAHDMRTLECLGRCIPSLGW